VSRSSVGSGRLSPSASEGWRSRCGRLFLSGGRDRRSPCAAARARDDRRARRPGCARRLIVRLPRLVVVLRFGRRLGGARSGAAGLTRRVAIHCALLGAKPRPRYQRRNRPPRRAGDGDEAERLGDARLADRGDAPKVDQLGQRQAEGAAPAGRKAVDRAADQQAAAVPIRMMPSSVRSSARPSAPHRRRARAAGRASAERQQQGPRRRPQQAQQQVGSP
jgi:hypothetical protein